jgi:hypothetical protein
MANFDRSVMLALFAACHSSSLSRADPIYTVTVTGEVLSGTDEGAFGVVGSLAGQSYSIEQ